MSARSDRPLSISVSHPDEGTYVVSLSGDLDIASAGAFAEKIESLTAVAPARVVVEISGVEFIDSSGLNALVVAARDAERAGGSLAVAGPSSHVSRVFDLVQLDEAVEIVDAVEAALTVRHTADREAGS